MLTWYIRGVFREWSGEPDAKTEGAAVGASRNAATSAAAACSSYLSSLALPAFLPSPETPTSPALKPFARPDRKFANASEGTATQKKRNRQFPP